MPHDFCCKKYWDEHCRSLQEAIDEAEEYTVLKIDLGTFCSQHFVTEDAFDLPIVVIKNKKHLKLVKNRDTLRGKLKVYGSSAIHIEDSEDILIEQLDIEGNARTISGEEAAAERDRVTGKHGCNDLERDECHDDHCVWNDNLNMCIGHHHSYFTGHGIVIKNSHNIVITRNSIKHMPGAGIFASGNSKLVIADNNVFGNGWWSYEGMSGIVVQELQGEDTSVIFKNLVVGNKNFIPVFDPDQKDPENALFPGYGKADFSRIVQGHGIHVRNSASFGGILEIDQNFIFENGVHGIYLQGLTSPELKV
jgi:hypothetical protein